MMSLTKMPKKVKIWDGTNTATVNSSNELQVRDDDAITELESIEGKDFSTETTLSLINDKLVDGNDIGDVTVNNAAGGSAVNIQDGGNSITVDAVDLDIRDLDSATDSVEMGALDSSISTNSDTQLNVTQFDSSGNEGQKIIGIGYLSGNSGIDASTETLQTIEYEHHEIHSGSHFYICNFEVIDSGDDVDFAVTTPDTAEWAHMVFKIAGTSQTEFYVYEDSAVTGGTSATPLNNNRNSTHTSVLTIVKNPTVNTLGTEIYAQSSGLAGSNPSRADTAGFEVRDREIMLKQDTTYIFRITSQDNDNVVSYCGEWYENINKN